MYKRVDKEVADVIIDGFSYMNLNGDLEFVSTPDGGANSIVTITVDDEGESIAVYHEDIPMLVKALQASYNFKGE